MALYIPSFYPSMELSKQGCSLQLARRLKELGVEQQSLFYWVKEVTTQGDNYLIAYLYGVNDTKRRFINIQCSAFTVAELGEMLPRLANYRIWQQHSIDSSKLAGKWVITINDVKDDKFTDVTADTEA